MKKRTMGLATAGLALGIVLMGSVPANAITFPGLNCTNSPRGPHVGVGGQASGTTTITVVNGPSSWGHVYPFTSTVKTRNGAPPSALSSASYFSTTGGTTGIVANGCYAAAGWN